MNPNWKTLIVQTTFWLAAEVLLNMTGLDDLADYSEYIFEYLPETTACHPVMMELVPNNLYTVSLQFS